MKHLMHNGLSTIYNGLIFTCLVLLLGCQWTHAQESIHLYIDADRTGTRASGIAIEQGIRVALDEVNYKLAGQTVKLVILDHHGSSVRSKKHLQKYIQDSQASAVYSGLHSPPLLENLRFINENNILILDPWAAAGPITRFSGKQNWVFRLSVDDSKAGSAIVKNALAEGLNKPFLLLEETGWGKSNHKTMTRALKKQGLTPAGVQWFNWNLGKTGAKIMLRNIVESGADSILLVANAPEGKTFAKAMLALSKQERLPIRSHWGITGGDFPQVISHELRAQLDLKFLQTRFSFVSSKPTEFSQAVFTRAKNVFPQTIKQVADIQAPTGFIHAYDITRLLIAALKDKTLSGDTHKDRAIVRDAMENIHQPVKGLIKTYQKPYGVFNKKDTETHEALNIHDLVMA